MTVSSKYKIVSEISDNASNFEIFFTVPEVKLKEQAEEWGIDTSTTKEEFVL